jgi:hypothetical protein
MKKLTFILSLSLICLPSSWLLAKYEQEQIQIETQLQERIEGILSKTLPAKSYLVTVKVEMENRERPISQTNTPRARSNSLSGQNQYVLPGVPGKKVYVAATDTQTENKVSGFSAETLVSRISITVLVASDVTAEQIRSLRDIITGSIPFNPLRGDEMQIQNSSLLKPVREDVTGGAANSAQEQSLWKSIVNRANAPVLMIVGALMTILILFIAFLFGPMRAFLNRLLAVLPRVGEQAAYTVSNAPKNAAAASTNGTGPYMNGNGFHDPKEEGTRPFHFVREDQLNKLPILCRSLSPAQCALILAYLPAEWASKVLGALEPNTQTSIMRELSQAREVPSAVVTELEELVKAKLPYLVGGEDWIQSVYQLTQPQTQRALLGTLNQQSPELAQALRRKTFFLEDLGTITAGALRLLLQEASYPISALAMRDEKQEFRDAILKRLPVAMREILQQELELAADDKVAIAEAKIKLLETGRRLLVENRFSLQDRKGAA